MPPAKTTSTNNANKAPARGATSSEDLNARIEQVAPEVVALLCDGVPRSRATILAALAERHPRNDVKRTLMRLAVIGTLVEQGGKYRLPPEPGSDQA